MNLFWHISGECITGHPDEYPMNTGYKGIFLLIDNTSTAKESLPQEGKVWNLFCMLFENITNILSLISFNTIIVTS